LWLPLQLYDLNLVLMEFTPETVKCLNI